MIRVGLIGCGFMGGMHAACYAALAELGVKVTAIADDRPEFLAQMKKSRPMRRRMNRVWR